MKQQRTFLLLGLLMLVVISDAFGISFPSQIRDAQKQAVPRHDTLVVPQKVKPRWRIQRTQPIGWIDLDSSSLDLQTPIDLRPQVTFNDTLQRYIFGQKLGGTYLGAPLMMTQDEYLRWRDHQQWSAFFRRKNAEIFVRKGKDKFDFSDMHLDLGPAEKIFGPGGVRIRTQGTAELRMGFTHQISMHKT